MAGAIRFLTMGAAGLGAAGAGLLGLTMTAPDGQQSNGAEEAPLVEQTSGTNEAKICLENDLPFLSGDQTGCHSPEELRAWRMQPLAIPERGEMKVMMTHPTDATRADVPAVSCHDYEELRFDGWFAMTSREMRREAFFIRSCGVINMLARAKSVSTSYFDATGLTSGEIATLGADRIVRLGVDPAFEPADPEIEVFEGKAWRVTAGEQVMNVEEIALLDFDSDEIAEILAFVSAGPAGGSARLFEVILIEKDSPDGVITFAPMDFSEAE